MNHRNNLQNHTTLANFKYKHKNPYHEKLKPFSFVLRDNDCEEFRSKWKDQVFKNNFPIHVEIGSGYGYFMLDYCQTNAEINFIGLDYRFKRSFELAKRLQKIEHNNFKYLRAKGERLHFIFGPSEIERLFYFFPDPWPKTRHHKNRLFSQTFIDNIFPTLKDNAQIWIKTDHLEYAQQMHNIILKNQEKFEIKLSTFNLYDQYPEHPIAQFQTKFEKIFIKQNTPIKSFIIEKIKKC